MIEKYLKKGGKVETCSTIKYGFITGYGFLGGTLSYRKRMKRFGLTSSNSIRITEDLQCISENMIVIIDCDYLDNTKGMTYSEMDKDSDGKVDVFPYFYKKILADKKIIFTGKPKNNAKFFTKGNKVFMKLKEIKDLLKTNSLESVFNK